MKLNLESITDKISQYINIPEYIENRKAKKALDNKKRTYIDSLQYTLSKIIDDPKKITTGSNYITLKDNKIMPVDTIHAPTAYTDLTRKVDLTHVLDRYIELCNNYRKHKINITVNGDNTNNTKTSNENIEILFNDRIRNFEKKYDIQNVNDFKNAKKDICEYIQHGKGSWIYTPVQGELQFPEYVKKRK